MPKINRKVIKKLFENYFGQSIHFQDDDWDDVPDIKDDKEFTTQLPLNNPINPAGTDTIGSLAVKANLKSEQALEEIKRSIERELELKLKSGKDLLQDPSSSAIKDDTDEKVLVHEPKPLKEQKPGEAAAGVGVQPSPQPQGQLSPGAPVDPNTGQPAQPLIPGAVPPQAVDPYTGLPIPQPEEKSPKDIGRTYELKKIYSRLIAVDSYLSSSSDQVLLKLRKYINKSLEMFDTLLSNLGTFKDQIDDIIIIYYKFIDSIYDILRRYYEGKKDDEEKLNKATMKDVAMVDLDKLASQEKI